MELCKPHQRPICTKCGKEILLDFQAGLYESPTGQYRHTPECPVMLERCVFCEKPITPLERSVETAIGKAHVMCEQRSRTAEAPRTRAQTPASQGLSIDVIQKMVTALGLAVVVERRVRVTISDGKGDSLTQWEGPTEEIALRDAFICLFDGRFADIIPAFKPPEER